MDVVASLPAFVPAVPLILRRPVMRHRLEAISGTVLVGLGPRVAVTSR